MKKLAAVLCLMIGLGVSLQARKLEPWQDPEVFEENRLPMRASFETDQQDILSLNGRWRFHWSPTVDARLQGFEAVSYNDALWKEMPVPGMWELNGFGHPVYVNNGYPWGDPSACTPPFVPAKGNHVGQYRRTFEVPSAWNGKQVRLCVGSATSNVRVWVNGKPVGYSEDSKLEAHFDVTKLVHPGINVIALEVFRWCDGTYLEDQDFWRMSGIARGVYLYTREKEGIQDVHVSGGMDGRLTVEAAFSKAVNAVQLELLDPSGRRILYRGGLKPRKGSLTFQEKCSFPVQLWSAETPVLYTLKLVSYTAKGVAESTSVPFGFRTVELRDAQLLVNGQPVLIKGVNRHELDPYKGYEVSEADMLRDIRVMKELNINAVRTCHYPDYPRWLALCDQYGLYVVAEGNIESHGMGYADGVTLAQDPQFRAAHIARDSRMVQRDYNHPCIIVWSLGNEAGSGGNFVDAYEWVKAYDPTRPVQYENGLRSSKYDISDICCPMYWSPARCKEYLEQAPKRPLIQCEYAHAMGNSMGNFKEYWDLVRQYPAYQGGFVWDFADQALWNGSFWAFGGDFDPADPSDGTFNCNGVVASNRSLHPHAHELWYQYRNILTTCGGVIPSGLSVIPSGLSVIPSGLSVIPSEAEGSLRSSVIAIHNEFFFTDLRDFRLLWSVEANGEPAFNGVVEYLSVPPQETRQVELGFSAEQLAALSGAVTLTLRYQLKRAWPLLPAGTVMAHDQFLLRDTRPVLLDCEGGRIGFSDGPDFLVFNGTTGAPGTAGERSAVWTIALDKRTGALCSYTLDRKELLAQPLLPCFSRAPVENDLGAGLPARQAFWRQAQLSLQFFGVMPQDQTYLVQVDYVPIGGTAAVSVFYQVYADGSLSVVETLSDAGGLSQAPELPRFGMRFAMPGSFGQLDFLGLGPWENYADRCSGALFGRYQQSVAEQYHRGYVRTQESGTHTGLRYFRILDAAGNGLEVASALDFSASALPYSLEQLDVVSADGTAAFRHPEELKASGNTYVHVDAAQMGVGGINSWGTLPLDAYRLPARPREFRFLLRPVLNL